jgi:hypothetical protein
VGLGIADGVYAIRLRLYRTDGTFAEALAHNVVLHNGTSPIAVTGVPGGESAEPPTAAPTATPTGVLVDLPPTSTPRPSATPFPAGAPAQPAAPQVSGPTFDLPSFGRAFRSGIGWAAAAFMLIGLYAALRPRLRPYLWRLMRRLVKSR